MKKSIPKLLSTLLLSISLLFATSLSNLPSTPVYAIEETTADTNSETVSDPDDAEDLDKTSETDDGENTDAPEDREETPGNDTNTNTDTDTDATTNPTSTTNTCQDQTEGLSWVVCPTSGVIAKAIDSLYNAISDLLIVNPISTDADSPIYIVWQYARSITNIVFIIFLIIVIYSQLTGLGITNYGVKRILPRLIITVILVNLSFIICSVLVDASNIIGEHLREFFGNIQLNIIENATPNSALMNLSISDLLTNILGGVSIAGIAISATGGSGALFFMLLVILLGGIIAVVSGLVTIAARQALVALLIMISPLAFIAYLLPGTERWFGKWKSLLSRMLVFYPTFSFLFGASELVGYTLLLSATSEFGILLGIAVQIFPLIFSWSLMKMSGTVLGSINTGVRKVLSPVQRGLNNWALSRAEQSRANYLANSAQPGARLRRYLDYRRTLRDIDTKNSVAIREGQAIERATKTITSSRGRRADGLPDFAPANRYTHNAKRASLYNTRRSTAELAYKNVMAGYGNYFKDTASNHLSESHSQAYEEAQIQQYLSVNEAQADQEWLLNQYLKAINDADTDPREYNRLVKSAAGGLKHLGESSIMGQVIVENANHEARRRSQARIIMTKFGIEKPLFRSMVFDVAAINDNGLVVDEDGNPIEDNQHNLLPNKSYTPWNNYIASHKITKEEITKEQYDRLSPAEKRAYNRIRIYDIRDDNGKLVQRVYDDDAGYMKEMLADDIAIGDPINERYMTEIGVAHAPGEHTGMLRRYHSTIRAALETTKYREHMGEATSMLLAQLDNGYITDNGQLNIARLQSFNVSTKAGAFLQNDPIFLRNWIDMLSCINNPERFAYFFPDAAIMNYRNVNAESLGGMIANRDTAGNLVLDANGSPWKELTPAELLQANFTEADILEARKNLIKHKIIPKTITQMLGMLNRNISPNLLENQKPGTSEALEELIDALTQLATSNEDPNVPVEEKLSPGKSLYKAPDPGAFKRKITQSIHDLEDKKRGNQSWSDDDNSDPGDSPAPSPDPTAPPRPTGPQGGTPVGGSNTPLPRSGGSRPPLGASSGRPAFQNILNSAARHQEYLDGYDERNDLTNILEAINEACDWAVTVAGLEPSIMALFDSIETLTPYTSDAQQIFDTYRFNPPPNSTDAAIQQNAHIYDNEEYRINLIRDALIDLVNRTHI